MTHHKITAIQPVSREADYPQCLRISSLAWIGLCWLVLGGSVYAQQPERAISAVSNLDYVYSNLPTQPVGPDDLLALSVYDSPELTRTVRVDADGNIRLPMLRDAIQVRGMVPAQVESTIANSLTKGKVLVDPIVTVTIVEYQSRPVNVVGAVKTPLVFQATRPVPLLDAIARAGGSEKMPAPTLSSARKSCGKESRPGSPRPYLFGI
jgi:protein involved in polysaccharide export with SLBB domain